jgi:hypothetical protein
VRGFGHHCGGLGVLFAPLGRSLGRLGGHLGSLWGLVGSMWRALGVMLGPFGGLWAAFGSFWASSWLPFCEKGERGKPLNFMGLAVFRHLKGPMLVPSAHPKGLDGPKNFNIDLYTPIDLAIYPQRSSYIPLRGSNRSPKEGPKSTKRGPKWLRLVPSDHRRSDPEPGRG